MLRACFMQALGRIKKNAAYFRVNYLIVMLASCVTTFVMHPSSLFVLGLLMAAWIYLLFVRQAPVVISGRQLRWAPVHVTPALRSRHAAMQLEGASTWARPKPRPGHGEKWS
jgi:hypothetical protein